MEQLILIFQDFGAHSIFLGQVRADEIENKKVMGIEYSIYKNMANKEISKICESAFAEWSLSRLHIYHSNGLVKMGEISLFVFVSAGHRIECLEAVHQIVEDIKHKVTIWKKEIYIFDSLLFKPASVILIFI